MNRGHSALTAVPAPDFPAALAAYDIALALLAPLVAAPAAPELPRASFAAALLNRGHALAALDRPAPALAAFTQAVTALESLPYLRVPTYRRHLAAATLARARLQFADAPAAAAADTARVLHLLAPLPDPDSAELTLQAHALRLSLQLLPAADPASARAASDEADAALALIHRWLSREPARLLPSAAPAFALAVELHRRHLPHFLAEFIYESLPPLLDRLSALTPVADATPFIESARAATHRAWHDLQNARLATPDAASAPRTRDTATALAHTHTWLTRLAQPLSA